jgi:tRNA modification GTPase
MTTLLDNDTICAIATPIGRGGIGIIRLSGANALDIAGKLVDATLKPRYAHYGDFRHNHELIDQGICIYFPNPHSFTGEDVVELQGHGGPILLDKLLSICVELGARVARPGEFSERAFLNGKLDLAQVEAIADLINASSEQAARSALLSLEGEFSKEINELQTELTKLRVYVEAAIDFPEEEIDFLSDGVVQSMAESLTTNFDRVQNAANQGAILRDGMTLVIAGRPNAGKSSLLNALTGKDSAIVTNIAGTTRDVLREQIHIDGMPLHIIDTAGLRESPDVVEQEGIRRAQAELTKADHMLLVVDSSETSATDLATLWPKDLAPPPPHLKYTVVQNKIDVSNLPAGKDTGDYQTLIRACAKSGEGIDSLREHLKDIMGYQNLSEGVFMARRRHIDALNRAREALDNGLEQLYSAAAGELFAEDMRYAQMALGEITGKFTSDDLLGEIFSSFCIGK